MPGPLNWSYLTTPADRMPVWGPYSIAFLVIFGLGLVGMVAVRSDAGSRLGRDGLLWETVRRAAAWLAPIFAVGLLCFGFRVLRIGVLDLSMRLWLYLVLAAALLVSLYFVRGYRRAAHPEGRWWPIARREADGNRWYGWVAVALFVVYMAIAAALYILRGVYFHPDRLAVLLFLAALLLGQWKAFLRDWLPVVFLLFGYEFMRGLAYEFISQGHRAIHLAPLLAADRAMLGGNVAALWLQQRLYVPGTVHWYDVMAVVLYAMHFVFPLLFAFLLWVNSKERFWNFTLGLLLLTYAGFVVYLLYPAAPPWLADQWGVIHGLQIPFNQVWHLLIPHPLNNLDQVQLWNWVSGNPVAAMPSLHAAYPWLTTLYAIKFFRWKGLLFAPYNPAIWFTVLYLGQHWVIDILAGIALASLCFGLMELAWPRLRARASRPRRAETAPAAERAPAVLEEGTSE